jgi:ribonuclease HI
MVETPESRRGDAGDQRRSIEEINSAYRRPSAATEEPGTEEAHAYTDGASTGSRGPGGYGVLMTWQGKTKEIGGGEQDTTNLRMELTAACVALEMIDEGHIVTLYSDSSYLVNCMRRGWYKKWRENGWLNHIKRPVANRDLWERLPALLRRLSSCGGLLSRLSSSHDRIRVNLYAHRCRSR